MRHPPPPLAARYDTKQKERDQQRQDGCYDLYGQEVPGGGVRHRHQGKRRQLMRKGLRAWVQLHWHDWVTVERSWNETTCMICTTTKVL